MFSVNVRPYLEPKKQPSSRSLAGMVQQELCENGVVAANLLYVHG